MYQTSSPENKEIMRSYYSINICEENSTIEE